MQQVKLCFMGHSQFQSMVANVTFWHGDLKKILNEEIQNKR